LSIRKEKLRGRGEKGERSSALTKGASVEVNRVNCTSGRRQWGRAKVKFSKGTPFRRFYIFITCIESQYNELCLKFNKVFRALELFGSYIKKEKKHDSS